ncbi:hypothetical protein [Actinomadura sp. 6N118]|uniref:hypothetical protein n=1 Tax=Actinomadura sp. 6N118 TaxID=3375151 RepID=UPI0037B61BAE
MRIKNTGFNSAVVPPTALWRAMFLRGGQAAQTSAAGLEHNGPIGAATFHDGKLNNVPEPHKSACEGALMLPPSDGAWQMLLSKGDRVCHYDWDRRTIISEEPAADFMQAAGQQLNPLVLRAYGRAADGLGPERGAMGLLSVQGGMGRHL